MSIRATLSILEGGGDGDARREAFDRPREHGLRLLPLELDRELARLELVDQLDAADSASLLALTRSFAGPKAGEPAEVFVARAAAEGSRSSRRPRRSASEPASRPSTAWSSASVGMRRNSERPIAAPGPSPPRRKMSYAWRRLPPSSRAVVPWKPMSPTQCWAQACGQPSRWSLAPRARRQNGWSR